jgi:hypothetical protein
MVCRIRTDFSGSRSDFSGNSGYGSGSGFSSESESKSIFYLVSCSVSDPDPCGSVKWLTWIRIRIGNTNPDTGQSKWCPKSSVADPKLLISAPDPTFQSIRYGSGSDFQIISYPDLTFCIFSDPDPFQI